MDFTSERINENRHKVQLSYTDIKELVTKALAKEFNFNALTAETKFDWYEETEGSPPYRVGFGIRVTIIESYLPRSASLEQAS